MGHVKQIVEYLFCSLMLGSLFGGFLLAFVVGAVLQEWVFCGLVLGTYLGFVSLLMAV
jgi:hypothetical protein